MINNNTINIIQWNATGLQRHTIHTALTEFINTSILFITETWLLSPNRFPTNWTQYHTYGIPVQGPHRVHRGQMGISLLVHPHCPFSVNYLPNLSPNFSHYSLSCTIGDTLIHCLYLPPTQKFDDQLAIEILDSLPKEINGTSRTIYCGDFNARLGDRVGDHLYNTRGRLLTLWLTTNGMTVYNESLAYGKATTLNPRGTSIVDLFFGSIPLNNSSMKVYNDISLSSDHKAVQLTYNDTIPEITTTTRPMWRIQKLKDPDIRSTYINTFTSNIQPLHQRIKQHIENHNTTTLDTIEEFTSQLNNTIYNTLDATIGRKTTAAINRLKWFWTPELNQAKNLRETCYKKWRRAQHPATKLKWWLQHQEAQAKFRLAVNRRRAETWTLFCKKLDQGDFSQATATMKRIRKRRMLNPTFSDPHGPTVAANRMADYLEKVFSGTTQQTGYRSAPHSDHTSINTPTETEDSPFTEESVINIITQLPSGKAPGADSIKGEMLKPICLQLTPFLTALYQLCWYTSKTPRLWRLAQVLPIHKKGPTDNPANFRPISLTSIFRKIMEKCIQDLLVSTAPVLDIVQAGFRHQRDALSQARCLHELSIMHKNHHGSPPVLLFLDVSKAYDTVNRNIIWNTLEPHIPPLLLSLLKNLFDNVSIEILLSNQGSRQFHPNTGVLQGSVLSPILYSHYINSLPTLLRTVETQWFQNEYEDFQQPPGLQFHGLFINCLLYADDVALIGTWDTIPLLLQACEDHSKELGYQWNPNKCIYMSATDPLPTQLPQLYHINIQRATTFTYLGVPFNQHGCINNNVLIDSNTTATVSAMNILASIGVRARCLGKLLSTRFYRQFIRPKMEYGLAITKFSQEDCKTLQETQNTCLRKIYGTKTNQSMAVIHHIPNLENMTDRITILQAKFIFRSFNMPDDALFPTVLPRIRQTKGLRAWNTLIPTNTIWK